MKDEMKPSYKEHRTYNIQGTRPLSHRQLSHCVEFPTIESRNNNQSTHVPKQVKLGKFHTMLTQTWQGTKRKIEKLIIWIS